MGKSTGISWADSTANLWIGCTKVSAACDHCYAEDLMGTEGSRFKRVEWGPHGERQRVKAGWLDIRRWQHAAARNGGVDPELGRKRRIFVNSLSDFFDNHRSVVWRADAWDLIRDCPDLIFMLVTKRPQLIPAMLPPFWDEIAGRVWLLTTVENQQEADRRLPHLLGLVATHAPPAAFGVSCEPLLGPLDIAWAMASPIEMAAGFLIRGHYSPGLELLRRLVWVIVGGESGKEARPMNPAWVRSLRDQCAKAYVSFHFKQWGEWAPAVGTEEGDVVFREPHPDYPGSDVVYLGLTVRRVGKHGAGNELDGIVYEGVPA